MYLRGLVLGLGLLFMSALSVNAQSTTAERFGAIAETWDAQISPDGKNLALGCSPNGVLAICIYALDSDAKPRLLLAPEGANIRGFFWANDQYLLQYVTMFERLDTSSGLRDIELRRYLSYDMETQKTALLLRNRPALNSGIIESLLKDKTQRILMARVYDTTSENITYNGSRLNKNVTTDSYYSYDVDLKTGKAKDRESSTLGGAVYDDSGKKLASILRNYKKNYFAVQSHLSKKKIVFEDEDAALAPLHVEGLNADKTKLIVDFDKGGRDGLYTLSLIDGKVEPYTVSGRAMGDVGLIEDRHRSSIVGYYYTDDTSINEYSDDQLKDIQNKVRNTLKIDNIELTSWTADRSDFVVAATKPGRPTQYYLYNAATPSLSPVGGQAPWLDDAPLGTVTKITYSARDGKQIPAYLTLPPGKSKTGGPFPLVLMPHGGPESRDTADYDWLAQAVAAEGFAVLQPNFRGSSGYGAAFRNAGYGEFGGKMVTDVLDGATHLVSQGIAKSGGHCTMGWSYGGYSALMTGLHDPGNTKCMISINGVTDPIDAVQDGPVTNDYWQLYMGDFFKTKRSEKKQISPFDRASEYTQPILLIHGKEDTTVDHDQSSKLAGRVSSATLVSMPGDDHGMLNTASRTKILQESLAFLASHHPTK